MKEKNNAGFTEHRITCGSYSTSSIHVSNYSIHILIFDMLDPYSATDNLFIFLYYFKPGKQE